MVGGWRGSQRGGRGLWLAGVRAQKRRCYPPPCDCFNCSSVVFYTGLYGIISTRTDSSVYTRLAQFSGQLPGRNAKRFPGRLVFKARRLLYHSTLGSILTKKKRRPTARVQRQSTGFSGEARVHPPARIAPAAGSGLRALGPDPRKKVQWMSFHMKYESSRHLCGTT